MKQTIPEQLNAIIQNYTRLRNICQAKGIGGEEYGKWLTDTLDTVNNNLKNSCRYHERIYENNGQPNPNLFEQ